MLKVDMIQTLDCFDLETKINLILQNNMEEEDLISIKYAILQGNDDQPTRYTAMIVYKERLD